MKYIGPFFRMNSLSINEITTQLFHLSKEAVKTITLNSKCGIIASFRSSKKNHSNNDISILNNFSPLLCLYKKSSPNFVHNKTSYGFDESTFRKTISPATNALMTLSLLELSNYYSNYNNFSRKNSSLEKPFSILSKKQLDFYSTNLRNSEGFFIEKKNISDSNYKGFNLVDNNKSIKLSNQSFMMLAYYLYSKYNPKDTTSSEYKDFAFQILDMFYENKEQLYEVSFDEGCKLLMSFNIFYDFEKNNKCKSLIIDLSDFLINKYEEKDYYVSSLDSCCLLAIDLIHSFKHTEIISFNDKSSEILDKLLSLYDSNKGIFIKTSDKKEIKYSSLDISFYLLLLIIYSKEKNNSINYKNIISNFYRKFFINSGIVSCYPEAPTLDEVERYKKLSLNSQDMLDENIFRMPNVPSPSETGKAPIFYKNVTYSRKKDSFNTPKDSFDSSKNMLIYYSFIHYLKDDFILRMDFIHSNDTPENLNEPDDNEEIMEDNIDNNNEIEIEDNENKDLEENKND